MCISDKVAAAVKEAYLLGFREGVQEMVEDADPDDYVDLEQLDTRTTNWTREVLGG